MSDLDKAREWAEHHRNISDHRLNAGVKASAKVIQSLPDQWVDAEKVRELTDRHNDLIVCFLDNIRGHLSSDTLDDIRDFMDNLNAEVDLLGTPKLRTLADMTQEDREACQWVQADHIEHGRVIITYSGEKYIYYMKPNGLSGGVPPANSHCITPLPDLPKLEWPSSGDVPTVAEQENVAPDQRVSSSESTKSSLPRPEDVPVGEAWLVKTRDGEKREALKTSTGWMVKDGDDVELWVEEALEPVARLVPETHTLPEGMRLADHKEYGRLVVSPGVDTDGDHKFLRSDSSNMTGASWGYVNKGTFTFLDGDQHV